MEEKAELDFEEPASKSAESEHESLMRKLRLVFWPEHEPYIAFVLLACLIGMSVYFAHRSYTHRGLIDIDSAAPLTAEYQVDINSANWGEIVVLPGIGEKLAHAIVQHREEHGAFRSTESLQEVSGIGEGKMEALLPYLKPIVSEPINQLPSRQQ